MTIENKITIPRLGKVERILAEVQPKLEDIQKMYGNGLLNEHESLIKMRCLVEETKHAVWKDMEESILKHDTAINQVARVEKRIAFLGIWALVEEKLNFYLD